MVGQIARAVDVEVVAAYDGYALQISDPAAAMGAWSTGGEDSQEPKETGDRAIMQAAMDAFEQGGSAPAKFDTCEQAALAHRGGSSRAQFGRNWTAHSIASLKPSRHQQRRLKRLAVSARENEINLRGNTVNQALRPSRLRSEPGTRGASGLVESLQAGRRSDGVPVVKVAAANWLDGQGRQWVAEWFPEISADGQFGSVVLWLKKANGPARK